MIDLKSGKRGMRLTLSGELGFDQLPTLLQVAQQIEAENKPVTLDWSNLQSLHYACLQVLIALGKSVEARGNSIQFKEPSPELHTLLHRYGIWTTLGTEGFARWTT